MRQALQALASTAATKEEREEVRCMLDQIPSSDGCLCRWCDVADGGLAFGQPVRILEDDIPHAAPLFADVDGDGKKDLLVGQFQDDPYTGARVRLFRNIGTAQSPKFATPVELVVKGADETYLTVPFVADWNKDGRDDLILGRSDGSVVWLQNTAELGAEPDLATPLVLVEPGLSRYVTMDDDGHYDRPPAPTQDIRLCVVDYNNDGQLDLLLGDRWFLQKANSKRSDKDAARRVEAYAAYRTLRDQLQALQEAPQDETDDARTVREAKLASKKAECAIAWRAAYRDGSQFSRHGSVWLFERSVLTPP